VVLALQDRLAYGSTFQAALTSLFGNETSSLSNSETQSAPTATATPAALDTKGLILQASQAFSDYQRLTAAGKLAEAGQKLDTLKQTLEQLSSHTK